MFSRVLPSSRQGLSLMGRRTLFITTEETPNPSTLKFVFKPSRQIIQNDRGQHDYRSVAAAKRAPLAKELLKLTGVSGVFLGRDFVAVSKTDTGSERDPRWQQLTPTVYSTLMEFYDNPNAVAAYEDLPSETTSEGTGATDQAEGEEDEIVLMIKELLEEKVRPMARDDGGDVLYVGWEPKEGVVQVQLVGSCVGCPSSTITLKNGVENMLRHYIPEVKRVDSIVEPTEEDQSHHLTFNNGA
ncbi:hypothetical protein BASA81_001746 [Batrachochytrium salamandrivorans]|nr:hypothetical protein BASA81_001746 [Batrachochytrium salamandrivorans]